MRNHRDQHLKCEEFEGKLASMEKIIVGFQDAIARVCDILDAKTFQEECKAHGLIDFVRTARDDIVQAEELCERMLQSTSAAEPGQSGQPQPGQLDAAQLQLRESTATLRTQSVAVFSQLGTHIVRASSVHIQRASHLVLTNLDATRSRASAADRSSVLSAIDKSRGMFDQLVAELLTSGEACGLYPHAAGVSGLRVSSALIVWFLSWS